MVFNNDFVKWVIVSHMVVHSMDRLARNLDDLRKMLQSLTKRGVRIEFVE